MLITGGGGGWNVVGWTATLSEGNDLTVTTPPFSTEGAHLIVLTGMNQVAATTWGYDDSEGNSYTSARRASEAGVRVKLELMYCYAPTTDLAHTFTMTSSTPSFGLAAIALRNPLGTGTGALAETAQGQQYGNPAYVQSGSVWLNTPGQIIVAAYGFPVQLSNTQAQNGSVGAENSDATRHLIQAFNTGEGGLGAGTGYWQNILLGFPAISPSTDWGLGIIGSFTPP